MNNSNIFDERFNQVSHSLQYVEDIRAKLIQSILDLNEARKVYNNKQKELTKIEVETSNLKKNNHDMKVSLMKVLIDKEEFKHRKSTLESNIERLEQQIEDIERETEMMMLN